MRAGSHIITRVVEQYPSDARAGTVRDDLSAPIIPLALWWAENWWRLRYEAYPGGLLPSVEWRMCHELTSVSGGVRWPPVMVYGSGERVVVAPRAGIAAIAGPIRYLDSAVVSVHAQHYEHGVDRFFERVRDTCTRAAGFDEVATVLAELDRERQDPELTAWRRIEAMLGFDPDAAPDELMSRLAVYQEQLGVSAVDEAAASAPGGSSADSLADALAATAASVVRIDRSIARELSCAGARPTSSLSPWQIAEGAAKEMRTAISMPHGPIRAKALSELLKSRWDSLNDAPPTARDLPYGAVSTIAGESDHYALQSDRKRSSQRRFELARALGDAIWEPQGAFAPISRSKTDRQKFQRAFAQSFLCPFDDLVAFINTLSPTEEDVRAAARHFHVSEGVVQTALVNKSLLPRETLAERLEAA